VTEAKSTKKADHVLHKTLPRETCECQPSLQRWYGDGDERCISCALLFVLGDGVVELEILEVREETDEIQDLSTRAPGLFEGKKSKRW